MAADAAKRKSRTAYAARIAADAEYFVAWIDAAQRILACPGIIFAGANALFSEYYLEQPIESGIHDVRRIEYFPSEIAETGNPLSNDIGAAASVIKLVPRLARCIGTRAEPEAARAPSARWRASPSAIDA
ncbi:hypothetical protein EFP18_08875 [Burkholderia glumae]|uniref:thermostable hemolysin n=1 Tax=Burkholderia glumae TaxID=337 RepID=UPI000F5EE38F|nr:hypothetical protein GAS18_17160 [Burkholderia glumae]RQZ66927.1 hypothetical protein DF052_25000 [Burkholderia glumae]UVS84255.1 hypothetical protein EFP18_08875 [Burkholderia glumae]